MSETKSVEKFILDRTFNVPIDVMFEMWTNPEHLAKWVPPTGFNMEYFRADIREGGSSFYRMGAENGKMEMFGRAEYSKITKPNQIVYKQQFTDAQENIARHPMSATWPETLLTTIDLTTDGADRTKVKITWEPYGKCTDEELDTFAQAMAGMTQGWTGSLNKLEAYLSEQSSI